MEQMASDIRECLMQARFAAQFLQCFRGINKNGVFDDEEKLKKFLRFSEEQKEVCKWSYGPKRSSNPCFESLVMIWDVPEDFERKYISDYKFVMNNEENRTLWKDKYSTTLNGNKAGNNIELQPIPDYVTWFKRKGKLHYLSYEKTAKLYEKIYIDLPALLLPSRVLDLLFLKNNAPPEDIIVDIAILAWIPVEDVKKYFQIKCEKMEKEYQSDLERETWRSHNLYKKSVVELQQECKNFKQSTTGQKHELVKRLALASGETERETLPTIVQRKTVFITKDSQ